MIEILDSIDKDLLVFLNGFHNPFWDPIMWWISSTVIWIPFYIVLLVILVKSRSINWPKQNFRQWLAILISIGVAISLADLISARFIKPFFSRLRPSHSPDIEGLVHLLTDPNGNIYTSGLYGFVSSHAANSFAIAWFAAALINTKKGWTILLFWATLISYSRIYLGVHYPGDIIGGALLGIGSGYIASKVYFYLENKWQN